MLQHLALPECLPGVAARGHGSTRVEQSGDWLLAGLNDVLFDFAFDASHVSRSACASSGGCW